MSRLRRGVAGTLAVVAVLGLGGCGGDEAAGPDVGTVEVLLTFEGPDQDANGGTLYFNGESAGQLIPDVRKSEQLESGIYVVKVTGIAPNCAPLVPAERNVTVRAGEVAKVDFKFLCESTGGKDPGGDPVE